jgi:hypothetical protein
MAESVIKMPLSNQIDSDTITVAESNNHLVSDLVFYKKGNTVMFTMTGAKGILDNTWVALGVIKTEMRPKQNVLFSEVDTNANNAKCLLQVRASGDVYIYCYGGGAGITHALSDTHSYIIT